MWKRSPIPFIHNRRPLVMAHRGDSANVPENTLPAFDDGYRLNVDCLETDIRLTKDNQFVFMHDPNVGRTTNGKGLVLDFTLADLQSLDLGYKFKDKSGSYPYRDKGLKICTFDDIIPKFPNVRLNMDIKNTSKEGSEAPILLAEKLKSMQMEQRVQVASFHQDQIDEFRKHSSAPTSAGPKETLEFKKIANRWLKSADNQKKMLDRAAVSSPKEIVKSLQEAIFGHPLPYVSLAIPERILFFRIITPDFVKFAHMLDIAIFVWTVNEKKVMEKLLDWGVDGLFTDCPGVMLELLKTRGFN